MDSTEELRESHLRRINSTLALIDQRLDEMQRRTCWPAPEGPLYRWRQDLDGMSLTLIAAEVGRLREELGRVVERLGLEPQERPASRAIHTGAIFSLVDLEDLEPARIRAYGALTAAQEEMLDRLWKPLRLPLEGIRRACGRKGLGDAVIGGKGP